MARALALSLQCRCSCPSPIQASADHPIAGAATLAQRSRRHREPVHCRAPNQTFRDGNHRSITTPLILKRASASRPTGQWQDEDYDVLADGQVVGRNPRGRLALRSARAAVAMVHHRYRAGIACDPRASRRRSPKPRADFATVGQGQNRLIGRWRPRFRTFQVRPKDLSALPRQADRAVCWHSGFQ
jgi:hypothetical protein